MKKIVVGFVVAILMLAGGGGAWAGPKEDATATAGKFIAVFSEGKSVDDMVALFTPDALMWGTTMLEAGTGSKAVRDYFANAFTTRAGPTKASILTAEAAVLSDSAVILAGKWQTDRTVTGAPNVITPLRYTMVVTKAANGQWLIAHLHSSRPESVIAAANAALAAATVAAAPAAPAAPAAAAAPAAPR